MDKEQEVLDLKLFKFCYPKLINPRVHDNAIWYGLNDDVSYINQFTKDIALCFSVLIPEMNRRGWYHSSSQIIDTFEFQETFTRFQPFFDVDAIDKSKPLAICLAAIKALEGVNYVE